MSSSNPELAVRYRRTRFVCVADTHNRPVKLPKGDVLIHAGDLTNQGSYSEVCHTSKPSSSGELPDRPRHLPSFFFSSLRSVDPVLRGKRDKAAVENSTLVFQLISVIQLSKAVQWLEKSDFEAKIVIAGITGALDF